MIGDTELPGGAGAVDVAGGGVEDAGAVVVGRVELGAGLDERDFVGVGEGRAGATPPVISCVVAIGTIGLLAR